MGVQVFVAVGGTVWVAVSTGPADVFVGVRVGVAVGGVPVIVGVVVIVGV